MKVRQAVFMARHHVRTVPRFRHNPQFNVQTLPVQLASVNIGYFHALRLYGFRRAVPDSPNGGRRNLSFRGYADYMQTAPTRLQAHTLTPFARVSGVAVETTRAPHHA